MASNNPTGVIKKKPTIRKSVHTPKEEKPKGFAIPAHFECLGEPTYVRNFAAPQFNTVLGIKQDMERIGAIKPQPLKSTLDLTPRSKSTIMPKVNQKLNIDVSKPVFKNLPSLNVNDSILLPKERLPLRKKYNSKSASKKPPVPELCDFLDPLPPLKHVVELPEIELEFPEFEYDFLAAYKRYAAAKDEEEEDFRNYETEDNS